MMSCSCILVCVCVWIGMQIFIGGHPPPQLMYDLEKNAFVVCVCVSMCLSAIRLGGERGNKRFFLLY